MKLNKDKVARRVNLLAEEGIEFVTNANIGVNVDIHDIKANNDALILCVGTASHLLTHSLTHSYLLTYSLTHLLTYSLTHSPIPRFHYAARPTD